VGGAPGDAWQAVTVHAPDGVYRGIAEGVDETGALLLRQPSGEAVRILAGDVLTF
jgi:biotin-(acetyl-CoA carboxylase) ligase